jgi:hypothetical protein
VSDHLEVITPTGDILFFPLDPNRGVTSIGAAAANDLRLAHPGIPDYAATLDHRQRPYTLVARANGGLVRVNRRALANGETTTLQPWDGVEIGGAVLILAEDVPGVTPTVPPAVLPAAGGNGGAAATVAGAAGVAAVAAQPSASQLPALQVAGEQALAAAVVIPPLPGNGAISAIKNDLVPIRIDVPVRMVETGQPATWELTVTNGGMNVARCHVTVVGDLYNSWISISDNDFRLNERQSQKITITLLPPRHPSSRAGEHHFAVEVRLTDVDTYLAREPGLLVIQPYYQFATSSINPPDRNLRYGQRYADFEFTIENKGNSDVRFQIDASESEKATRIEFLEQTPNGVLTHLGEREVVVPPQLDPMQNTPIQMRVRPLKRKVIASFSRMYAVNVSIRPAVGDQPVTIRQTMIRHQPLTGRWVILAAILLAVVITVLALQPRVRTLTATYENPNGEPVTAISMIENAGFFGGMRQRVNELFGRAQAAAPAEVVAAGAPALAGLTVQIGENVQVRDGEPITLNWSTRNGGRLEIAPRNPAGEPIAIENDAGEVRDGSLTFTPRPNLSEEGESQGPTIYEVEVSNVMSRLPVIGGLGVFQDSFNIEVVPANAPIINDFSVSNENPDLGTSVVVAWDVTTINPDDELVLVQAAGENSERIPLAEPVGTLVVVPETDTTFSIEASSNKWVGATPQPQRSDVDVQVIPPTATPVPPPLIRQFDVEPLTLLQGGSITVTYNISGADRRSLILPGLDPSRIELDTDIGRRFIPVPVAGQVDIVLEALNLPAGFEDVADPLEAPARAFATAVASRIALVPTATPTSTPPPTPTATPREPVIEVLNIAPEEIVLGNVVQVALTWNVIGDADTISIEAPDFTFTSTNLRDTIAVPGDRGRTFVLTASRDGEPRASKSVELKAVAPTETPVPPPPPPPTETPTPTATPVPAPRIVQYLVESDEGVRTEIINNEDNFFVDGGAPIRVKWVVDGATRVDIQEILPTGSNEYNERLASDQISVIASADDVVYRLTAINDPNNNEATASRISRTLRVRLNPARVLPPPTNVTFTGGITATSPVIIAWEYSPTDTDNILGFRIYKAQAGSQSFVPIVDEGTLPRTARIYEDTAAPTCDRAYYLVAVYQDLRLPGEDKTVETDAGNTSFITPPCQ